MDPFKTEPTGLFATALVSLGNSGRFSLGVVPKQTAIANRPVPFDANDLVLISFNRFWRICINTNCENQNGWLDYWSGREKKKKKKKKITGSIIGPAMAGPTGPFATALEREHQQNETNEVTVPLLAEEQEHQQNETNEVTGPFLAEEQEHQQNESTKLPSHSWQKNRNANRMRPTKLPSHSWQKNKNANRLVFTKLKAHSWE